MDAPDLAGRTVVWSGGVGRPHTLSLDGSVVGESEALAGSPVEHRIDLLGREWRFRLVGSRPLMILGDALGDDPSPPSLAAFMGSAIRGIIELAGGARYRVRAARIFPGMGLVEDLEGRPVFHRRTRLLRLTTHLTLSRVPAHGPHHLALLLLWIATATIVGRRPQLSYRSAFVRSPSTDAPLLDRPEPRRLLGP